MAQYCDVAVAGLPLDSLFTYRLPAALEVSQGSRVVVPFRRQRMVAVVAELHDRTPGMPVKEVVECLDGSDGPALSTDMLRLGRWISDYYLAPLGEVFRSMLPLGAEFRRTLVYRITDEGRLALDQAGRAGILPRSRKTPDEQLAEARVLDHLAVRGEAREQTLKSAARVSRHVLDGMVRKEWIIREDASRADPAARTRSIAVLAGGDGKRSPKQKMLIDVLVEAGGRLPVETLRELRVSRSALETLARRGVIQIVEEPAGLKQPALSARGLPAASAFSHAQQLAFDAIGAAVCAARFRPILLHGVTGSGKTAVYLAAMKSVLDAGGSAILLVPEIGLTPAMAAEVHSVFGDEVAILHSALSDRERAEHWRRIRRGEARAIVGTRSAVFAPVSDLALVIVDEEQDGSYKQEEAPRYHARDVAVMRAKFASAVVVLGSATPSLESYFNARNRRYTLLQMPDRIEQRPLPEVEIVDMRREFQETGREQVLSRKLIEEIRERLERNEQAIVLLNRRGYSPLVLCRSCGNKLECRNCAIALTHHKEKHRMECHYCGFMAPVPETCPACGSEYVYFLGTGAEKLEELLHGVFPQARIARLDRDTVRSHADFERALAALHAGELDLLVGTQMIAKGHDIHGVTLVGVVGADAALGLPDFRAAERTFQLLTQVAGRAGRGEVPGKVILQTYFSEHYAVEYAARHDFVGFYERELRFRSWMHYPPYSSLANLLVRGEKLEEVLSWAGALGRWFDSAPHEGVRVLGPAAAPIIRLKRDYRYHFILKSESRQKLNVLLRAMLGLAAKENIPRTSVVIDVDALRLM
ncbi:MAG: primosomal protein N' [Acidobacteria bacterium]|nr:primosomal protein N' [Acidobacteriota bacterium]